MAAYYHSHHHHGTTELPPPPDHNNALHHTLILMNPNFATGTATAYPDHHPPPPATPPSQSSNNILLLNSAAAAAAASGATLGHHSPGPLHHHGHGHGHHQFVRYPPQQQQESITLYGYPQAEVARDLTRARQGLSLSLSSHQNPQFRRGPNEPDGLTTPEGDVAPGGSVLGSKYLKAAQELLEEVVHVGDHGKMLKASDSPKKAGGPGKESSEENRGGGGGGGGGGVQLSSAERQELQMKKAKLVTMLNEAEERYRQYHHQMQIVIASFEQAAGFGSAKTYTALALKTISKQFRCLKDAIQTQIRSASKSLGEDEGGGGGGSGSGSSAGNKIEGSRWKYIDHQIRQQRALQQLGMIQNHNAWRPQRGLPERSVSVLRAWLFEHFLHPYPKDSDKIMLAKQTGLTRSQVSNWFINARVRLWKPMIEEMYTEEIKEHEQQNGSEEKTSSKENSNVSNCATDQEKMNISDQDQTKGSLKDRNAIVSSYSSSLISTPTSSALSFKDHNNHLPQNQHGFTLTGSLDTEGISQGSPKRPRNDEVLNCNGDNREVFIKFGNDKQQGRDNGYPMISGAMNFVGGGGELGSYPTLGELGRFGTEEFPPPRFLPGNGISLSLGLPPCENQQQQLNLSATNHTFLSPNPNIQFRRANDFGSMSSPSSHSSAAGFECIDIENRKGFAAQLLPDFVA